MDAASLLAQLGGTGTTAQLRSALSKQAIRRAVDAGSVLRISHGRYALPSVDLARREGTRLGATVSHTSAALFLGWKVKWDPDQPHLTVRRKRHLRQDRSSVTIHWRDLGADDTINGWVTNTHRTVIDCCLDLPFDEALTVADSALRAGVDIDELFESTARLTPRQRKVVRRVLHLADGRAANPFESVTRAICLGIDGLSLTPQLRIRTRRSVHQVDLASVDLRLVIEADSFEFHADRKDFSRDCRRYNDLVASGWVVLRVTWEMAMLEPAQLRSLVSQVVTQQQRQLTGTNHALLAS